MKKTIFFLHFFAVSFISFSQIGINTSAPNASLDVVGNPTNVTITDGVIIPRISGNELKAKDALYTSSQTGTLIYVTGAASPTSTKTIEVTAAGLYIFNGTIWKSYSDINIYKDDGTVTAGTNRTITIPNATNLNFSGKNGGNIYNSVESGKIGLYGYQNNGNIEMATYGDNGDINISTSGVSSDILLNPDPTHKNVGIGTTTPTTKLHVNSVNSPAVRIVDGTQKNGYVLTTDANGNSSWKPAATKQILGILPTTGPTISTNNTMTLISGASITLPTGMWIVSIGTNAGIGGSTPITNDVGLWFNATLSTSNSTVVNTDVVTTASGSYVGGSIGRGMIKTMVTGNIVINNTSGANKTYYLWASREAIGGTSSLSWTNAFGNAYWERWFSATAVN